MPVKQRHTATRILARLRDEHQATDLSYSTVRERIMDGKPRIDGRDSKTIRGIQVRAGV